MNKKSFKIIGLVSLVASTVLLVACQSDTKTNPQSPRTFNGVILVLLVQTIGVTFLKIINSAKMVKNNLRSISPELRTLIFQN